jgi:hypothetical protein
LFWSNCCSWCPSLQLPISQEQRKKYSNKQLSVMNCLMYTLLGQLGVYAWEETLSTPLTCQRRHLALIRKIRFREQLPMAHHPRASYRYTENKLPSISSFLLLQTFLHKPRPSSAQSLAINLWENPRRKKPNNGLARAGLTGRRHVGSRAPPRRVQSRDAWCRSLRTTLAPQRLQREAAAAGEGQQAWPGCYPDRTSSSCSPACSAVVHLQQSRDELLNGRFLYCFCAGVRSADAGRRVVMLNGIDVR